MSGLSGNELIAPLEEFLAHGRTALQQSDPERAGFYLHLCIVMAPQWGAAVEATATLASFAQDHGRVFDLNQRAALLGHSSANLWLNMLVAAERLGRPGGQTFALHSLALAPGHGLTIDGWRRNLAPGKSRYVWARRLVFFDPHAHLSQLSLAICAAECDGFEQARASALAAIILAPDAPYCWSNGSALVGLEQGVTNAAMARRATRLDPNESSGWANWSLAHDPNPDAPLAVMRAAAALALAPYVATSWYNLANILAPAGKAHLAVTYLKRAVHLEPATRLNWHNLLFNLHYVDDLPVDQITDAHLNYGRQFPPATRPNIERHKGPIRVGFVSGDFRRHSVTYFFTPFLAALDRTKIDVTLFANNRLEDDVSAELKHLAGEWVSIAGIDDDTAVRMIYDRQIEILVDLAGYSSGNRIEIFARYSAPVQATWLGYVGTLGLPSVAYRLTDACADPIGPADQHTLEKLVRIEGGFLAYRNDPDIDPGPCPSAANGFITFASFNNLAKMTPDQTDAYAEILRAVPRSRLILKSIAFADPATARDWRANFHRLGIDDDRLDLLGWVANDAHLALYGRVDIALDTYPYAGTTTTCDALWMGVPVVSRVGDRHAARMGFSLLSRVGLADLAPATRDGFIKAAIDLAHDPQRRAQLRTSLRAAIISGPLGDGARLARQFEQLCGQWLDDLSGSSTCLWPDQQAGIDQVKAAGPDQ